MEFDPRPVDVPVTRPIGKSLTGKDSQPDVAGRELLAHIGRQKKRVPSFALRQLPAALRGRKSRLKAKLRTVAECLII